MCFTIERFPPQVLVIGSGIGGLYLAALLAKSGRVVLVLEQCPARWWCPRHVRCVYEAKSLVMIHRLTIY